MLVVEDVCKSFATAQGRLPVLRGASLSLQAGESLALMGESGSGKSTLLHLLAGLDRPDSGRILVYGQTIAEGPGPHAAPAACGPPRGRFLPWGGPKAKGPEAGLAYWRRTGIGLVFQQYNLIGSLDVAANVDFQARLAGRYEPEWSAHLAERLGLADLLSRYPEQLSGGQQQRVAIARALASRPALVLADEPTGSLDEGSADAVLELMLALVRESASALLMVTHSARLAARLARRLTLHQGRIEGAGEGLALPHL